ncbi:ribosomal protein S18-alanine N-acetyltransferase [Actinomyces bowdenii]|uniref:Ribosomal-protein-alanine N-acetyltransferase n=2 Tax=Actinomyces bowdenii TaxID=131109 RepID=A0A3P1VBJ3_9ACTO|nr:ribosomal protein S18-alanine N-acetyltransferase [Actinomyces bowdenii]RRD30986.1 ribosomal-protein-alanine N-acetyltransferase [Actinomyces bowdenii]
MAGADLARIALMEAELFGGEAWSLRLLEAELEAAGAEHPDRRYIVVEEGGHPVGYAGIYHAGGAADADLLTIATLPAVRGRGLARLMLEELVGTARAQGCGAVLLEVRRSNTGAQRLYLSQGFEPIGLRRGYYAAPREDAVVMRLGLREPLGPVGAEAVRDVRGAG